MIKKNLIANYLGQGWTTVIGLVLVPVYIRYLGVESYGVIGIFALIQAWFSLLDLGMTPALSREMSCYTAGEISASTIRNILRSIEIITVSVGSAFALIIYASSNWIAGDWLKSENVSKEVLSQSIATMGVIAGVRLIEGVHRSALIGLQKQLLFNIINCAFATFRGLGAVAVVIIAPTLAAFFFWQGIMYILSSLTYGYYVYKTLGKAEGKSKFCITSLKKIINFAGGMLGISLLTFILTQVDKFLLSRILTLREYGYYALASIIAGSVTILVSPIAQAFYPRLIESVSNINQEKFINLYHTASQVVTVIVGSFSVVLIVFTESIILLWTKDKNLGTNVAYLVKIMAIGNLLNSFMWIPFHAQLASGYTRLALKVNFLSILCTVPALIWLTPHYGAIAAAWVWVILNSMYFLISVHFIHIRILKNEKWEWYKKDIIYPVVPAFFIGTCAHWAMPKSDQILVVTTWITISGIITLTTSVLFSNKIRKEVSKHFQNSRYGNCTPNQDFIK